VKNKIKECNGIDLKIKALEEENRRLRDKIKELQRESSQKNIFGKEVRNEKTYSAYLRHCANREKLFSRKNFASYIIASIKTRSLFLYYQRLIYVIRKYTFITTTLKILTFFLAIIQSSALFVLFTGTLAISAPITVLFSYIALTFSFFERKKLNRNTKQMLKSKKITVFFPPKERAFEKNSYFRSYVDTTAKKNPEDTAVIIVSPFYFSPKGISNSKRHYAALRIEDKNIILIRKHYYFTFRKNVLKDRSNDTTFIF
jgi:hypothetical protein